MAYGSERRRKGLFRIRLTKRDKPHCVYPPKFVRFDRHSPTPLRNHKPFTISHEQSVNGRLTDAQGYGEGVKLLILGGTQFVGRHMAEAALDRGWKVSLYHRGKTNPDILPEARHLLGDRNEGYPEGEWDVVFDVSAYVPRQAGEAARILKADRYLFVSTVSVYDIKGPYGPTEDSPRVAPPDPATEEVNGDTYGGLKTACEDIVLSHRPDAIILRPGLVVGPYDHTDRFDRWARAFRDGGEVPVPTRLDQPLQVIHARDLAEFALDLFVMGRKGAYNGVGPETTLEGFFNSLMATYPGSQAVPTEGTEGPLVLSADGSDDSLLCTSDEKSRAAGLRARPIETVARESLEWLAG